MAVFRIERTRDYTVMSNHHLRNGCEQARAPAGGRKAAGKNGTALRVGETESIFCPWDTGQAT